ncbi:hypothetical protein [Bradyrhizobium ottawaense]|uniref:hypothetical protein n=1 Tax=Bradyrhizobium ottawaense TaxID=931866 RepID=UPI0004884394|nr:hypothetical protein [Bradyrhizobium ottawaense]
MVEAINAVQEGQILVVDAIGSSCDQVFRRSEAYLRSYLAKRHYIAGKFDACWRTNSGSTGAVIARRS